MPDDAFVQTVLGPVAAADIGITLTHEHLLCDLRAVNFTEPVEPDDRARAYQPITLGLLGWLQLNWTSHYDNLVLDDEDLAIAEARRFRELGGATLVDCTLAGIGRDPHALVRIARATGLNIVMGTGYYVAPTHPPDVASSSEVELAQRFVDEVRCGVGDTDIRAGLIGEIGVSWPMQPAEARVLRAAGLAQTELACGVSVHPGRHQDSPAQVLDVLRTTGADLSRVVIDHVERTVRTLDGLQRLADHGCFLEYDLFGMETTARHPYRELGIAIPSDAQRLDQIQALVAAGCSRQLLLSHDVCTKHRTRRYGGLGYDHLLRDIVPWMRQRGFDDSLLHRLLVENPGRALGMPTEYHRSCTTEA